MMKPNKKGHFSSICVIVFLIAVAGGEIPSIRNFYRTTYTYFTHTIHPNPQQSAPPLAIPPINSGETYPAPVPVVTASSRMDYNSSLSEPVFPITKAKLHAWQMTLDPQDRQEGRLINDTWAEPNVLFAVNLGNGIRSTASITVPITDDHGTHYFFASGHAFTAVGQPVYAVDYGSKKLLPYGRPVAHVIAFENDNEADVALVKMDNNRLCQLTLTACISSDKNPASISPPIVGDDLWIDPGYTLAKGTSVLLARIKAIQVTDRFRTEPGLPAVIAKHLIVTTRLGDSILEPPISRPGDSGSIAFALGGAGRGIVGMLKGGNEEDTEFVPMGNAMHHLRLLTGDPTLHIASVPDPNFRPN